MWQRELISQDWKVLMILDACRYDYFKKNYRNFLEGDLEKRESFSTWTLKWANHVFTERHDDIVYVSGAPFINSKMEISYAGLKFFGKEMFHKVIDVWDFGWDKKLSTVPPAEINKAFLEAKEKYPEKKFILHYVQPHPPFIPLCLKDENSRRFYHQQMAFEEQNLLHNFRKFIATKLEETFGQLRIWKLRQFMGMPTFSQEDYIVRNYGLDKVREFYEENLLLVLKRVSELVPEIDGKIVVTADHGHLMGEHGMMGHSHSKKYKELVEIPYFETR